jgi:modulator of FtsH protease
MTAYDASEWTDFFVAGAGRLRGARRARVRGVSINVDRILRLQGLPDRALATVLLLLSVVLVSLIGLIPGQSRTALAGELLGVGLVFSVITLALTRRSTAGRGGHRMNTVFLFLLVGLGTVPVVLGAVSLFAEAGGGLYWVAAGIVLATTGAVANAWVLLVEILR